MRQSKRAKTTLVDGLHPRAVNLGVFILFKKSHKFLACHESVNGWLLAPTKGCSKSSGKRKTSKQRRKRKAIQSAPHGNHSSDDGFWRGRLAEPATKYIFSSNMKTEDAKFFVSFCSCT